MATLCALSDVFLLLPGFDRPATDALVGAALSLADADLRQGLAAKYIFVLPADPAPGAPALVPPAVKACCQYLAAYLAICMSYTGGGEDKIPALAEFYRDRADDLRKAILAGPLLTGDSSSVYPVNGPGAPATGPAFVRVDESRKGGR